MDDTSTILSTTVNSSQTTAMPGFDDEWQRTLVGVILVIGSLSGIIGNSLVIMSVVLSRKLRSITNVFVVNLSVADLLTCLALPWNAVALFSFEGWPLPEWICSAAAVFLYVPIFCSVSTLASIAINRLIMITKPVDVYKKIFRVQNLIVWIILLWLWPFVIFILPPLAADFGGLGYNQRLHTCSGQSYHEHSDEYNIMMAVAMFPIPLVIIIVCYIKIFVHVRKKGNKLARQTSKFRSTTDDSVSMTSLDDPTPPASPTKTTPSSFPSPSVPGKNIRTRGGDLSASTLCGTTAELTTESEFPSLSGSRTDTARDDRALSVIAGSRISGGRFSEDLGSSSLSIASTDSPANTDDQLSPLPRSRTATATHTSERVARTRTNSLPARRSQMPLYLTATKNNSIQLKGKDKSSLRRKGIARQFSSRIRNTIIEAKGSISPRQLAITKNMFYIVVVFIMCITPFIFCLVIDSKIATALLPYAASLVLLNSCMNPAIYAKKHPYFKKIFGKIVRCKWHQIPEPSNTLRYLMSKRICDCKQAK